MYQGYRGQNQSRGTDKQVNRTYRQRLGNQAPHRPASHVVRGFLRGFLAVPVALALFMGSVCGTYAGINAISGNGLTLPYPSQFFSEVVSGITGTEVPPSSGTTRTVSVTVTAKKVERDQSTLNIASDYRSILSPAAQSAYGTVQQGILDGTYDGGESDDIAKWDDIDDSVGVNELSDAWDAVTSDDPYVSARIGNMDRTLYVKNSGGIINQHRYAVQSDDDSEKIDWKSSSVTPDEAVEKSRERAKAIAGLCMRDANGDTKEFINRVFYYLSSSIAYADDDGGHTNDIYGALVLGRSKCYGMSCALKAVLDEGGVDCRIVTGKRAGGGAHAWNVVDYDGIWLACDVTDGSSYWHDDVATYSGKSYSNLYGKDGDGTMGDPLMRACMFGLSQMNDNYELDSISLRMLGWAK